MELRAMPWHESVIEAELAKTKVLVNASALGNAGEQSPIPAELLPPDLFVLDLVYVPRDTKLVRDAKAAGASEALNGDTMLLHQTAAAFNLWTGRDVSLDLLQRQLDVVRERQPAAAEAAAMASD
jgi:shikimate dehydrogenase